MILQKEKSPEVREEGSQHFKHHHHQNYSAFRLAAMSKLLAASTASVEGNHYSVS